MSGLVLHQDVPVPTNFERVTQAAKGMSYLHGVLYLSLLGILCVRLREFPKERGGGSKSQRSMVRWLIAHCLFNLALAGLNVPMFFLPSVSRNAAFCNAAPRISSCAFTGTLWTSYMLLTIRARATSTGASGWQLKLKKATEQIALVGPPSGMITAVITLRGRVVFDTACTLDQTIVVAVIATVLDTMLSLQLLSLFVMPLFANERALRRSSSDGATTGGGNVEGMAKKMRHVAKRNMILSIVQLGGTFVAMMFSLLTITVWSDEHDPELSYLRITTILGLMTSGVMGTATLLLMGNAWVPRKWRRLTAFVEWSLHSREARLREESQRQRQRGMTLDARRTTIGRSSSSALSSTARVYPAELTTKSAPNNNNNNKLPRISVPE